MDKQNIAMNNQMPSQAQVGQILSLAPDCAPQRDKRPFADNLEYLEALEKEALLMLVLAAIRAGKKTGRQIPLTQATCILNWAFHPMISSGKRLNPNLPGYSRSIRPGKAHQSGPG